VRTHDLERQTCPYALQEDHRENTYCPYGFWGLRHIIEQPPSLLKKKKGSWVLSEAIREIQNTTGIHLSIGLTQDPALDSAMLKDHVQKLTNDGSLLF